MRPTALAFSGRMGSGKTAISSQVAAQLGCPRVAFGEYVRDCAAERSLPQEGESLQVLGEALIDELGWERFCQAVLARAPNWEPGMSIVIDGIRHVEAVETLKRLVAPSVLRLVLVQTDVSAIAQRVAEREARDPRATGRSADHATEVQLRGRLPGVADFRVDGTKRVEDATESVVRWARALKR